MKKFLIVYGSIEIMLISVALMFLTLQWPGGAHNLTLALFLLIVYAILVAIYLRNKYSKLMLSIDTVALAVVCLSFIMKAYHLPLSAYMVLISCIGIVPIVTVYTMIKLVEAKD